MSLIKKYINETGYQSVVDVGEEGLKMAVFDLLKLKKGESYSGHTANSETAFVILYGNCNFRGNHFNYERIGKRKDVFSGKPTSVYLPHGHEYEIEANSDLEIALCSAVSYLNSEPVLIRPDDVTEMELGVFNWKRKAYFIIGDHFHTEYLYVGETFLPPGKWAFPPHRHDFSNWPKEVDMDEIYHFRIKSPGGFAIQVSYTDDRTRDAAYLVRDGDTTLIPNGYHPVGASPTDSVYFLWFMAGKERYFLSSPDPDYSWIRNTEEFLKQTKE